MVGSLAVGCLLALDRPCYVPVVAHMVFVRLLLVSFLVSFHMLCHCLLANAMHLSDNCTAGTTFIGLLGGSVVEWIAPADDALAPVRLLLVFL